jgi:hypothetical protein
MGMGRAAKATEDVGSAMIQSATDRDEHRQAAGAARTLTMLFDLQDDVKSDDVVLRDRGGPIPQLSPRHAATIRHGPHRAGFIFAQVRLGPP